ncbi:46147_t:CDS:2 [Gigaspora margarita]|uniref:46147_t:CDS:1 n=1 Tax=Gigaspora margarita TaxID=4874 RepID=A0ABN7UTV0_GIGMA|nr:46147_t:CDS:2 [Gigaspora margarita]
MNVCQPGKQLNFKNLIMIQWLKNKKVNNLVEMDEISTYLNFMD